MFQFSTLLTGLHILFVCRFDVRTRCRKSREVEGLHYSFDLLGALTCVSRRYDVFYIHGGVFFDAGFIFPIYLCN